MRWIAVGVVISFCLAACEISPQEQEKLVCTTFCKCVAASPFPAAQEECVTECVADTEFEGLPQDCAECIYSHVEACSTLEQDCEPICDRPQPPPGPDGGITLVDATGGP